MQIKNKKILITGGAGFIGSHLVSALLKKNNEIVVIDNLSAGLKENINTSKIKFTKGDILDRKLIIKLTKGVDVVFHFAAQPDVRKSYTQVYDDFEVNVKGTINVLEGMRENKVKVIIFASSAGTIYGETKIIPTPESHPLLPISHYGASKAACEQYLSSYAFLFEMTCVSLRYGNIFGPRSNHGVIYDFFWKLNKSPEELEILGDGRQEKSYLYIDDCISASLLAAEKSKRGFNSWNISSDKTILVRDIAKVVIDEIGLRNTKIRYTGGRRGWPGDVAKAYPEIGKIKKVHFKSKVSCEEGIRRYVRWLKEVKNAYL